jgi:hypothetical protein
MTLRLFILPLLIVLCPAVSAAQRAQEGNAYALIIGVGAYPAFSASEQLRYARRDADAFRAFLRSPQGGEFTEERVRFLVDERATRAGIYREVRWLEQRVRPPDRVYVYFTGHGLVHDDGSAYLMPHDADPDDPSALGIRADMFVNEIRRRIDANRLIFFIDACYSAAAINSDGIARGRPNIVPALREVWSRENRETDVALGFFSASANQRSWEDNELQHGVFTYFLLEGLRGAADGKLDRVHDEVVTAGELRSYLLDQVGEHTRRKFQPQEPAFSPVFDGSLALAVAVPRLVTAPEPISPQPQVPSTPFGFGGWRPAAPGAFTAAQTRAYLASLGTILYEEDYEPRADRILGGHQDQNYYLYYAGGRMLVDSRYRGGSGITFGFPGVHGVENFLFHTTVSILSADSSSQARFSVFFQNDSSNYFLFYGYAPGTGGNRGSLVLMQVQDGRTLPDIRCPVRSKPFWAASNLLIKYYYGRLQIWMDESLCVDMLRPTGTRGELTFGAGGFAEVAYDDVYLVQLR